MRIDVVTLFPGIFSGPLQESILARAQERGAVTVRVVNLRDYAEGRHRVTDDYPFGGGGGMILKPEPLWACVEALRAPGSKVILLDPQGRRFTQEAARTLAGEKHLIFLCGRYEGVDERVRANLVDDELSIGDYVLTGGELPALVVIEAVTRLIPGVLGDREAPAHDSFAGGLLEGPHYTRPEVFRGHRVPEILLSGDHGRIARWRRLMSLWRTWQRRPDLLETAALTSEEQKLIAEFREGRRPSDLDDSLP
jgi:tRNA (guanine37-N1)-methyltransferase